MEEPHWLQSMGSQRVGYDGSACTGNGWGTLQMHNKQKQIADSFVFPGERMTTRSSILAWRILWTEEPGRLQSIGSKIVEHN